MTKIIFFLPSLGGGGAESHVVRLANGLIAKGCQVSVAVARSGGSYEDRLSPSIVIERMLRYKITSSTVSIALSVVSLRRVLRDGGFDVVVSATALCHVAVGIALRLSDARMCRVCLAQNNPSHEIQAYPAFIQPLIARAYRTADLVIALSQGVAGVLRQNVRPEPRPMLVISNAGYDTDLPLKLSQPAPFVRPSRFLIVACGRLHQQKAYPDMLRAVARVRDIHGVDAELWIMGVGPEEQHLRSIVSDLGLSGLVRFLGFVPNPYAVMRHADVFLLTSHWEGFGNVIVEAMSCGLPVVVTDCPYGPSEIVRDGIDGRLVSVGDIEGIAGALADLIRDPARRHEMARLACLRARCFDPTVISDRYWRVFDFCHRPSQQSIRPLIAAFAHDHRFIRDANGVVWSGGRFRPEHWREYRNIAPVIRVYARQTQAGPTFDPARYISNITPGTVFRLIDEPVSLVQIFRSMREVRQVDLVVARLPSVIGVAMAVAALGYRKPVYVEAVGCAWDAYWNHGTISARIIAPFIYLAMRAICARAQFVRYVTRFFLQQRYPTWGKQLSASDVALIGLGSLRSHPKSEVVFGCIGAFSTRAKGFDVAVEAVAALLRSGRRVRLELVGPGSSEWVTELAHSLGCSSQVVNIGVLPGPHAIARWLDGIDVYLQPSFQEGLPRALIEAMARGCPALGSTVGGIPELLDECCMHQPGDAATLATQCGALLDDPGRFARSSRHSLEMATRFLPGPLESKCTDFWALINRKINRHRLTR